MRKLIGAILMTAILITCTAQAAESAPASDVRILYEGQEVAFAHGIEPVDGVAIAALSDVVDTIGAQCSFELSSKRVTLRFGKHCLRLSVGSSFAHENGGELTLQAPVSCKNGTILVPIEDVLAALNLGYYTDADTKTVFITRGAGEEPVPQDVKVPILMYHAVSDDIWGYGGSVCQPVRTGKAAYLFAGKTAIRPSRLRICRVLMRLRSPFC